MISGPVREICVVISGLVLGVLKARWSLEGVKPQGRGQTRSLLPSDEPSLQIWDFRRILIFLKFCLSNPKNDDSTAL